jgi:hypothetical protein
MALAKVSCQPERACRCRRERASASSACAGADVPACANATCNYTGIDPSSLLLDVTASPTLVPKKGCPPLSAKNYCVGGPNNLTCSAFGFGPSCVPCSIDAVVQSCVRFLTPDA